MINSIPQMIPSDIPYIFTTNENSNPRVSSPNASFDIQFAQTRDTLADIELYRKFLANSIREFRRSQTYSHYKGHLLDEIGIDCCQYHTNIRTSQEEEMATIEMHHHILTIYDIAYIITEHVINSGCCISSFDLINLLGIEHTQHRVATVMLCKTCHQLQHHDPRFFVPMSMTFGNWLAFLQRFQLGVNKDIYLKIYYQIKKELTQYDTSKKQATELISIAETLENWSEKNEEIFGRSQL